uniref:Uncharacterized protein n=1 Tax=Sphaerodactylus townsendi TaxID=933632 RepID=A0ACB8F3T4_9SAUR
MQQKERMKNLNAHDNFSITKKFHYYFSSCSPLNWKQKGPKTRSLLFSPSDSLIVMSKVSLAQSICLIGTINMFNSQLGPACGYVSPDIGARNRQERSFN